MKSSLTASTNNKSIDHSSTSNGRSIEKKLIVAVNPEKKETKEPIIKIKRNKETRAKTDLNMRIEKLSSPEKKVANKKQLDSSSNLMLNKSHSFVQSNNHVKKSTIANRPKSAFSSKLASKLQIVASSYIFNYFLYYKN